jgi:hypothetical protein
MRTIARAAAALIALPLVLGGRSVEANFHLAVIDEVMSGVNGDASVQYVEVRMLGAGQTAVANTRLTIFSCDGSTTKVLLLVPGPALTGNAPAKPRWIMATPNFAAKACITPDFTFTPPAGHPGVFPSCGMICWGAPGMVPPPPASWDITLPDSYVDCVAYGPYTGPMPSGSVAPATATPGNGTMSLTRTGISGDDSADFALAAPSPTNNANQQGAFTGSCATTTSTSTTSSTVTSTTFAPGAGQRVTGMKLTLKAKASDPAEQSLAVLSKDPTITLGDGNGSGDDPTLAGGVLRVVASTFDRTYPLPAAGWQLVGKPGAGKGYEYKGEGAISLALVKRGKLVKAIGKGDLGLALDVDPEPVSVTLSIGAERYCLGFGGIVVFDEDKKLVAKEAPAPAVCAP